MVTYLEVDDAIFKALADASRRQLLDRLHEKHGLTLGDLCRGLKMTRQAVAKHLAILEKANLVSWERRGREKLHFINPVPINEIAERWINKFERRRLQALSDLKRNLEKKGLKPWKTQNSSMQPTSAPRPRSSGKH